MFADVVVAHGELHSPVKVRVHQRFIVKGAKDDPRRIIGALDLDPHALGFAALFVPEDNLDEITRFYLHELLFDSFYANMGPNYWSGMLLPGTLIGESGHKTSPLDSSAGPGCDSLEERILERQFTTIGVVNGRSQCLLFEFPYFPKE